MDRTLLEEVREALKAARPSVFSDWLAALDGPPSDRARARLDAVDIAIQRLDQALASQGGWRPIATAPKDGGSILAICATAYSPEAGVTWWQEGWTHYSRPDEKWHGGVGKWLPTHWQPLPPPPESGLKIRESASPAEAGLDGQAASVSASTGRQC